MKKKIYVYSFYRFKNLKKLKTLKSKIDKSSLNKIIFGTILIAKEGINGSVSGSKKDLNQFIWELKKVLHIRKLDIKIFENNFIPFYRFKVRLKKEIVTIGNNSISPQKSKGRYISPKNWDSIVNNESYLVLDTRNSYEVNIGTFQKSKNPNTKSFRNFPKFIEEQNIQKDQPIAMFCTGGIRCEKASSYLINKGYKNVVQLEGGILNYLQYKKNKKTTKWKGECFVFDNRVSINKKLKKGKYDQCYGCRHPITIQDKKLVSYKRGVHCKYCINKKSNSKINASRTRQNQIDFAEKNNQNHPFKKIYNL